LLFSFYSNQWFVFAVALFDSFWRELFAIDLPDHFPVGHL